MLVLGVPRLALCCLWPGVGLGTHVMRSGNQKSAGPSPGREACPPLPCLRITLSLCKENPSPGPAPFHSRAD